MTHRGDYEADAASAALAPYRPGTAAWVTVIPVTQVGVQVFKAARVAIPLASSNELTRMSVQVGSSCEDNTTWHFLPSCMLAQL